MRYMVNARTVLVLALFGCVSILLAAASAVFMVQARRDMRDAHAVVARADSLVTDWVSRGCAPRSKALP